MKAKSFLFVDPQNPETKIPLYLRKVSGSEKWYICWKDASGKPDRCSTKLDDELQAYLAMQSFNPLSKGTSKPVSKKDAELIKLKARINAATLQTAWTDYIQHQTKTKGNREDSLKLLEHSGRKLVSTFGTDYAVECFDYNQDDLIDRSRVITLVDGFIKEHSTTETSEYTHFRLFAHTRSFFNFLNKYGYINNNVFTLKLITSPKIETSDDITFFTKEEFQKLIEYLDQRINHPANRYEREDKLPAMQLKDFCIIGYYSGLREMEMLMLNWEDMDITNQHIHVRDVDHHKNQKLYRKGKVWKLKTKESKRVVPMHNEIAELLKSSPVGNQTGLLHRNRNDEPLDKIWLSKRFKKLVVAVFGKDDPRHLHSLRHSFCSNCVRNSIDLYQVMKWAGHARIETTQRYAKFHVGDNNNLINKL